MSAYRFYRLVDRLALPMKCQYVTLLGEWEHPWMEAVLEINNFLGVFLLCYASRKKTIETLVDREYLSVLSNEDAIRIVSRLIHAFSRILDEIEDALRRKHFLTEVFPYEQEEIRKEMMNYRGSGQ